MAASAEKIDPDILADLQAQDAARSAPQNKPIPEDVLSDLQEQDKIRRGDYPLDTVAGVAQATAGVLENAWQMIEGFAVAAPAAIGGAGAAVAAAVDDNEYTTPGDAYSAVFDAVSEKLTYKPRSIKGKKIEEKIAGVYNEWIEEKWGEHVGQLVDTGAVTPEVGAWMRTSADALLMGAFMRGGKSLVRKNKRTTKPNEKKVEVEPLEGEVIPRGQAGGRVGAEGGRTYEGTVIRNVLEANKQKLLPAPKEGPKFDVFRNKQAGAVNLSVIAEGVRKALRPLEVGANVGVDVGHALSRQVGFKHVTDIRKIPSPTAKMLADRIYPKQDSNIPLGAGFHEIQSIKEGHFNTMAELTLAPLRRHVINKNATSSLRIIALPKKVNDGLIEGLETGRTTESLVPAVRAVRSIFDELLKYQREAGVNVAERPGYFPHVWDVNKIQRAEFGPRDGGFVRHLNKDLGIPLKEAQQIKDTIIREDGILDFVEDTGGRLTKGKDFKEWSRASRVGGGPHTPPHVKARVIDTTVKKSGDWMVTDLEAVLNSYIRRAILKAEYTRLTGPGEYKLNQMVRQIIEEAEVSGKPVNNPHTTAQQIYDVFDALQNRFHNIENPAVRSVIRAASGWEVMAHLGLVSLAQLPETMIPAIKYRVATPTKLAPAVPIPLKSYAVGIMDAFHNAASSASTVLTGKRIIPKSEIRQHLESIGVVKVSALEASAARMMQTTGRMTNRFIRTVLMEAITDLQRSIAYDTINSMIRQNARYLAKGLAQGKRKRMYEKELIELGLKPEEVIDWYRSGMPKDHPMSEKIDVALVRGVDNTIIMPKAANAPIRYNDPRFQLPLLFTRFFSVFGNTVIKKVFKDLAGNDRTNIRKLSALSAMVASIGIAYYTQFLRENISGYQYRDEDDPMRVIDAVDRAGWTAQFTRLYPLVAGEYKYKIGSDWVANTMLGPVGTDTAKLIEAIKGSNEQKARWMASMTPIANITPEVEEELVEFYLELIETTQEAVE